MAIQRIREAYGEAVAWHLLMWVPEEGFPQGSRQVVGSLVLWVPVRGNTWEWYAEEAHIWHSERMLGRFF